MVFDVLGTVVDEESARKTAAAQLLASAASHNDAVRFAEEWAVSETERIDAVAHGHHPWSSCDEIRADALRTVASRSPDPDLSGDALRAAALFGRDIRPWPDSVEAVDALRSRCPVFALTNGSRSTMTEMFRRTGLAWTELVTADEVCTFKPNARMYERLASATAVHPNTTLYVAAHEWDLDAARGHGYSTALVRRPGVVEHARFDHIIQDLNEVVGLLIDTSE